MVQRVSLGYLTTQRHHGRDRVWRKNAPIWYAKHICMMMVYELIPALSHGAGRRNETLSDLVREIEHIDAHGEVRKISRSDTEFLNAASSSFGLIDVITHITLEVNRMQAAVMRPRKLPACLAIPPPPDMSYQDIPLNLRLETPQTDAEKQE